MEERTKVLGERATVPAPKVRIPAAHAALVPRGRLVDRLERHVSEPTPGVTLVCAPAGSGKTTLLSAWAQRLQHTGPSRPAAGHGGEGRAGDPAGGRVAWVSLDERDNDIFLLWSAVFAALDSTGAWDRTGTLRRLSPPRDAMEPGFLAAVVAAFDELTGPVWLVLDDAHDLRDRVALDSLDMLLRNIPRQLRLVLSGRVEPMLGLHRLRLDGRLNEIRGEHLTFTDEEAELLLAGQGVQLRRSDLDLLMDRTEGWAAGLRLAAVSLAGADDPARRIADFVGDLRAVADYLVGEVLSHLPDHVGEFLLATSVCDEFDVDLAVALSGRADAGRILDDLERANTLIVRLGPSRQWYRYHVLLRGYLYAELRRRDAPALRRLHRTASQWHSAHGSALPALTHAVAADDMDLATGLLEAYGLPMVLDGGGAPLRHVLDRLPEPVTARPTVALVAAAAALDVGDVPTADVRLGLADRAARGQPMTGRLRALHATVALHRARLHGDARVAAEAAEDVTETGDRDLDLLALLNRGIARLWLGDPDAAEFDLRRSLTLASAGGRDHVAMQCLTNLAAVAAYRGDLVEMAERASGALDFAGQRGWANTSHCSFTHTLLGWAAFQALDTGRARFHADHAPRLLEGRADATVELAAASLNAIVSFDTAPEPHAVAARIRDAWNRLGGSLTTPALVAYAAPFEQRMALRVGEPGWASDAAARTRVLLGDGGEANLLDAVLLVSRGRVEAARRVLRPVVDGDLPSLVATTLVDGWLLEAVLADRAGEPGLARRAVRHALDLAAARRALRPFVEGGEAVRRLLARDVGGRHAGLVASVLGAASSTQPGPGDVLTARELDTLAELPSMRTVEEIAVSLRVSANTVKTHLRGIYRKLGVRNRREAVAVARQRGLLHWLG